MMGLFRNSFLSILLFALTMLLLSGCGTRHAPPPEVVVPPPPVKVPPPKRQSLLPVMGYCVQVGAFAQVENAARLSARVSEHGLSAYYYREAGGLYRVRFGNFTTAVQAMANAGQLQQQKIIDVFTVIRPESYPVIRYQGQEELVRGELLRVANQFIGVAYQWGEAGPGEGFDCSGLAMMVYQLIGLDMPRVSLDQFRQGRPLAAHQLRPGDLVFFATTGGGRVSHVGIYVGNGYFVHAPGSGKSVRRASLASTYFRKRYLGARAYL